jgi:hypothetical protein
MAVSSDTVLIDAARLLGDASNVHWPAATLLSWLNECQLEIASRVPGSSKTLAAIPCVAGARQALPAGGLEPLQVQNTRRVDKALLDRERPAWMQDSASDSTTMWMKSTTNTQEFYLYPPRVGGTIEVEYAVAPATVTLGDDIGLNDAYAPALVDYLCYRALAEDTDLAEPGRAQHFRESYLARIGSAQG